MATRQINAAGLALVKKFESCSLEAYQDIKGVWTQGYGHIKGITADSPPCTQDQANEWLADDLQEAEGFVENWLYANPMLNLNDNQFSALVSLVYNCGYAALTGSIGKAITAYDFETASECFLLWDKVAIDGVLTVSQGLLNRRIAEQNLFNLPVT